MISVNINKEVFNEAYIPAIEDDSRYLILYGGAGSGKSVFAAQKVIYRSLSEINSRILVVRKVARTLKLSTYRLIKDIIYEWELGAMFKFNDSEKIIRCINGSEINFVGVDDPEKLKSITGVTSVWIEEATELKREDFEEIDRRLRGFMPKYKQIIMTFNPISSAHWIYDKFFKQRAMGSSIYKTTYKDNKFIDKEYKALLETYMGNARRVYTEGEFGVLENAAFTNIKIIRKFPETDSYVYGVDFGYRHPLAITKVYMDDMNIYMEQVIHRRGLLIRDACEELDDRDHTYYCDSESPSDIEEMRLAGFPVVPVNKYKGSRVDSIKYMLNYNLNIVEGSTELINEFQTSEHVKNNKGEIMDDIVKQNDDGIDSVRYAVMGNWMRMRSGGAISFMGV